LHWVEALSLKAYAKAKGMWGEQSNTMCLLSWYSSIATFSYHQGQTLKLDMGRGMRAIKIRMKIDLAWHSNANSINN
jgi:hypothetical protein